MRSLSLAIAALLLAATAIGQPFVERQISTPVYIPATTYDSPVIASNGSDFLAVWNGGLNSARISSAGEILDPAGIRVPAPLNIGNKAISGVFWVADAWVIVFSYTDSSDPSYSRDVTATVRIDDTGTIIDGPRVVLDGVRVPAGGAATNGSVIVLAYGSVAVLDATAHLLRRDLKLPQSGSFRYAWTVASNGSTFVIAWVELVPFGGYVLNFAAMTGDGVIGAMSSAYFAPTGQRLAIASDGDNYVIVFTNGNDGIAYAQRVSRDGIALERVALPYRFDDVVFPGAAVLWCGSEYVVVAFDTHSASYAAFKLDQHGQPIGPSYPLALAVLQQGSAVASLAWNGTTIAVARVRSDGEVAVTFFAADGTTRQRDDIVALTVTPQYDPAFAHGASVDLVAWSEPGGVYATRVLPSGEALDGRGLAIANATTYPSNLKAAYDVTTDSFVVLIQNNTDSFQGVKRIDAATGAVIQTISLGECWYTADIFADERGVLVARTGCDGNAHLARLRSDGTEDKSITIPAASAETFLPQAVTSIASNGSEYLVALYVAFPNTLPIPELGPRGAVYAIRMTTGLDMIDTQPFPIVDTRSVSASYPLAASDGKDFLMIWDNSGADIRGRYVSRDGVLLNGSPNDAGVRLSAVASYPTNMVFDGKRYDFGSTSYDYWSSNAYVTRVARTQDATAMTLKLNPESSRAERPSIISRGNGRIGVAYSRTVDESPFSGVLRVFVGEERPPHVRAVRH